jgi:hypothetical protein
MSGVVVCTECGNETEGEEQFCESCGTYLGWWGKRRDASAETVIAAEEEAGGTAAVVVVSPPGPGTDTASPVGVTAAERQAGGTAPGALASPRPPAKEAVRRPPRTLHQAWRRMTGALICTTCECPNPRSAHFCRTCGAVLVSTPPIVVTRWQRLRGRAALLTAGQHPGPTPDPRTVTASAVTLIAAEPRTDGPAPAAAALPRPPGKEAGRRPPRTLRQAWRREAGALICMTCTRPNPRSAHFCRTCGAVLVGTPPVVVTRWQRLRGRAALLAAGQRPGWTKLVAEGPRRIPRQAALIAAGAALVAVLVVVCAWLWASSVGDWAGRVAHSVRRDVYPYYDPIRPAARVRERPRRRNHRGRAAFDRDLTTYWVSPGTPKQHPPTGIGGYLVVRIKAASDLDRVAIFAGDPVGKELVPSRLRIRYFRWCPRNAAASYSSCKTTKRGHTTRKKGHRRSPWQPAGYDAIKLANKPGFQYRSLTGRDVGLVVITVTGVYDADSPGTAALTEVEFFRKR